MVSPKIINASLERMVSMSTLAEKMQKNLDVHFKDLDSLFRFYATQISAHSTYLVAWSFAFAVYLYNGVGNLPLILNLLFSLFFVAFFVYIYGRSLYYTELSNIVQVFMGLSRTGQLSDSVKFTDLIEAELKRNLGLADIMTATLYSRISWRLFGKLDDYYKNYQEVCEAYATNRPKAVWITVVNLIFQSRYKKTGMTLFHKTLRKLIYY